MRTIGAGKFKPLATLIVAAALVVWAGGTAHACAGTSTTELFYDPQIGFYESGTGAVSPRAAPSLAEIMIPGKTGYGFAVRRPDRALPYLRATGGRPVNDIGLLRDLGYLAVADLGTPSEAARLHEARTVVLGMRYFSIPVAGNIPSAEQVRRFSRLIADRGNRPLMVFGLSADLLGAMWTVHRLYTGAAKDTAFAEGRALGLTDERENDLRRRLENGYLKALLRP